jgi:hypothetical protein
MSSLLIEMGSHYLLPWLALKVMLYISASGVAGITGVSLI